MDGATQAEVGSAQSDTVLDNPDTVLSKVDGALSPADTNATQVDAVSVDTQARAFVCTTAAPSPGCGRIMFDLQVDSITPSWGHIFDGEMIFPSMVNTGGILVVGRSNQKVVYLFAATDPRPYHCAGAPQPDTGDCSGMKDSGFFNVDFSGQFVGSQGFPTLTATNFEFYTMSTSVPATTPVTEEKLPILMADATKIADVSGADMAPYLCSNN
jgi:hypothetical protein